MNKKLLHTALAALLLSGAGGYAHGQTTVDGLTYTLDSEALTATLTGFETVADDSIVNIPESVVADAQNYTVTAIGDKAFNGSTLRSAYREKMQKVKAIIIPKTVKAIGNYAFNIPLYKGSTATITEGHLESITFAEGSQLESIGKRAFGGKAIFELDLPEGLKTIGEEAFCQSTNLKRVGLPSTLDSIGPNAFYQTDSLQSIALPEGLRAIAGRAFYNSYNSRLNEITLPASLQSIGAEAFCNVGLVKPHGAIPPTIQSNTFPGSVKVVVAADFIDVYRAAEVWKDLNLSAGSFEDDRGRSFDIIGTNEVRLTSFGKTYGRMIVSVTIPENETVAYDGHTFRVAEYAAGAFVYVDTLHVERSYTALPGWTLRSLRALYLPASIEDLSAVSFSSSNGVELHLSSPQPPTISSISGIGVLYLDESLVPAYAESIWSEMQELNPFWEDGICYSRLFTAEKKVTVRDSKTEQLVIPATVSHDGQDYCVALISGIGERTRSVTIASAETQLGEGAFQNTYYLENAVLPEGMTTVPASLFANSGIKSVKLPGTVTVIGNSAFSRTTKLRQIDLPERVRDIQALAFFGSGIESLYLPSSVRNIWELAQGYMIKEFTVAEDNPHFCAEDGVLFSKDKKTIIAYPAGKMDKHYDMPSTVEHIANAAFYGSKLTSVRLSENYRGINENAVQEGRRPAFSEGLHYVYLPYPIESARLNQFALSGVVLYLPAKYDTGPERESYDSDEAFENAMAEWKVIQNQIEELARNYTVRYNHNGNLPYEYYYTQKNGEVEAVIVSAESARLPHNLNIPAEVIVQKLISNSGDWRNLPDSYFNEEDLCYHIPVVGIDDNVFALCDSLVNVTLPAGMKFIGEAAFYGCKNLESVQGLAQMSLTPALYYASGYENYYSGIYDFAFANCPKLTQLDFGGTRMLTALHAAGSTSLPEVTISEAQLEMKIDEEHPAVYTEDGVVYHHWKHPYRDSDGTTKYSVSKHLVYYPAGCLATEFVVPDSVIAIEDLAFAHSHIERLILPAMPTGYISSAAFYGNHSLTEVVLLADSLSQVPSIRNDEDYSKYNGGYAFYAYGKPYVYAGLRTTTALHTSHGFAWAESYPSFDIDYTRENTVVYMKQSVIDEYEEAIDRQDNFNSGAQRFWTFKQFFKEILPWQNPVGIESVPIADSPSAQGWFTLDGRRISQPTASGLYIHNGRKVVFK